MDWDIKDKYLKEVNIVCWEAHQMLDCYYQFRYLLDSFETNLDKINLAPNFFCETLLSMRYRLILGTAKLFEKDKNSVNIFKMLNSGEQNDIYKNNLNHIIKNARISYQVFEPEMNELFIYRDKLFAHQDKNQLLKLDIESILDSDLWFNIEKMLNWVFLVLQEIEATCGDYTMPYEKPINKLYELLTKIIVNQN